MTDDDLHARLTALEADITGPDEAGLITVMSALHAGRDVELPVGHPGHVRIDGVTKRLLPNARDKLDGLARVSGRSP